MAPQIVETSLKGGLNQRTAAPHVPLGDFDSITNLRQYKSGSLAKRPGNTKLTNQFQQPNNIGPANIDVSLGGALATYQDQILLACNAGFAAYSSSFGTFGPMNPGSEALLTRTNAAIPATILANTGIFDLMPPAVCTDGVHFFYVWITSGGSMFVTIEEIATGAIVQDQIQPAPGATNIVWAVPLVVGTQFTVVWVDGGGNIKLAGMASPYTGLFTVNATVQTGYAINLRIDALTIDATHLVIAAVVPAGGARTILATAAGAAVNTSTLLAPDTTTDIRVALAFGTLWMAREVTGTGLKVISIDPATFLYTMTGEFLVSATVPDSFAICGYTASRVVVAFSKSNISRATVVDKTLAAGAGAFVLDTTANPTSTTNIASKPFLQGGKIYIWLQADVTDGLVSSINAAEYGFSNPQQMTLVLCDTRVDVGQSSFPWPMRPVAVDAPRFTMPIANRNVSSLGAYAPLSTVQLATNQWLVLTGIREDAYTSPWCKIVADFAATPRWKPDTLGTVKLFSSGLVANWDGAKSFEQGFLNHAIVSTNNLVDSAAAGSLAASTMYYYHFVPLYPDSAGNLHRGIPSPLVAHSTAAGKTAIDITLPPISLTDKTPFTGTSSTAIKYPAYWEVYRSLGNPGAGLTEVATYFVDIITSGFGATTVTYTDKVAEATIKVNATCYTFGGALPNGCPPGAWDIVAHQGRAWIIAPDRSTLYFSKQIVDGEAVNFTDGFTLPSDVTDLRALASLDDKLIVFSDRRIYYLVGQGPADNGGSDDYQGLQIIQSDVGCIDRRSVVATPEGVFFQSNIGLYFIDRGLEVVYLGQPIADELASFPVVTSAVLHPTQPWVYFTVTNAAGNAGERLVYDYRVKQWYVDTLPGVPISAARTTKAYYWLDASGQVWQEDATGAVWADNGVYVGSSFTLSPMGNGTLLGWMRALKAQLLFHRDSRCDLIVTTTNDYSATRGLQQQVFWDREIESFDFEQLQIEHRMVETEAMQITFADRGIIDPSGGPSPNLPDSGRGATYFAVSFELEPQAGLYKISKGKQSKG